MAPVVTGDVNVAALEDLVRLCVELDRHRRAGGDAAGDPGTPAPDTTAAWAALEQAVIGKAVDLLSGPGGLAGFLRRRQLGARLGGPSLPLDIGYSESIPAGIRNAVTLRDRKCRWAGGCDQPASACDVHHVKHKARRQDVRQGLRPAVLFPPPGRHPPAGLDPGPEPGRHHHRVEQGQDESAAQPRAARPGRVTAPARPGAAGTTTARRSRRPTIAVPDDHRAHKPGPRCRTGPRLGDILSGPPPARDLTNTNRGVPPRTRQTRPSRGAAGQPARHLVYGMMLPEPPNLAER